MFVAVHMLAAALYAVLMAPFLLFVGLKLALWLAHRRGGPDGWLAEAERVLEGGGPGGRPRRARLVPVPVRVRV